MEPEKTVVIRVKLDEKTFKRFARFDMFALRKKWIRTVCMEKGVLLDVFIPKRDDFL